LKYYKYSYFLILIVKNYTKNAAINNATMLRTLIIVFVIPKNPS